MKLNLKIIIAETSAIIRSGLEVELKKLSGFRFYMIDVTGTDQILDAVRMHKPDLLIMNPDLANTLLPVQQLKEETGCPNLKCIALLNRLIDKGQLLPYDGKITIYDTSDDIRMKIETLSSEEVREEAADGEEQLALSPREKEIVVCVVKGMTNREIADRLYLSTHTVITHRRNIARKLQIHSASGLTVYAIVNKLVELNEISSTKS